jgi:MFS family permease
MAGIKNSKIPTRSWYYGWIIVAVSFLILTVVFGVRLSFTVFFVALIDEFGWSRADTALIFSVSMIVFAATSTLAGIGLDKWGVRRTFGVGAVILTLGLLLSSQIQNLYQLALTYGGLAGLGITILGLGPQAALIARWFIRRRGLAIGIAFAGTGIGSLLIIPGIEGVVSAFDWRASYIVLAGLVFATLPFIVFLLRLNPVDKGLHPDGIAEVVTENLTRPVENWTMSDAVRAPTFWLLMLAALGAIGPVRVLSVHQLAILIDAGYESSYAAIAIGFSGAITAIAFVLLGALSDKIDRRLVYMLGSISLILAIIILDRLGMPGGILWVLIYAILLGIGEGSRSSLVTAVASDLFPGDALGAINGAIGAAFGMGAAVLPWLAGLLYDQQGRYTTGFMVAVSAVIISTFSLWLAPYLKSLRPKSPRHTSQ